MGGTSHVLAPVVNANLSPRVLREEAMEGAHQEPLATMSYQEGGIMIGLPRQGEEGKEEGLRSKLQGDDDLLVPTLCRPHKVEGTHMEGFTRSGRMHPLRQVIHHHLWMTLHRILVMTLFLLPQWKKDNGRRGNMIVTKEKQRL